MQAEYDEDADEKVEEKVDDEDIFPEHLMCCWPAVTRFQHDRGLQ